MNLKQSKEYLEIQEISKLMAKNRQKIQLTNLLLLVSIAAGLLVFIKLFT